VRLRGVPVGALVLQRQASAILVFGHEIRVEAPARHGQPEGCFRVVGDVPYPVFDVGRLGQGAFLLFGAIEGRDDIVKVVLPQECGVLSPVGLRNRILASLILEPVIKDDFDGGILAEQGGLKPGLERGFPQGGDFQAYGPRQGIVDGHQTIQGHALALQ